MKATVTILFFFWITCALSQIKSDTLDRFNDKGRKQGYWVCYFSKEFKSCEAANAKYCYFDFYQDGKSKNQDLSTIYTKGMHITYRRVSDAPDTSRIQVLDGELIFLAYDEQLDTQIKFEKGRQVFHRSFDRGFFNNRSEEYVFHYDSLYRNDPSSFLFYKRDEGISLYKEYGNYYDSLGPRTYLTEHKSFRGVYRPRIAVVAGVGKLPDTSLTARSFIELGVTRRFTKGFSANSTKRTYYENSVGFQEVTLSGLGSFSNPSYIGQKLTYAYVLYLVKGEAGVINYTDFKKSDLRLITGAGITFNGRFSMMVQFYTPIAGVRLKDVPVFNIGLQIN